MIKKFNDYINEELKDSTYQNAAKKLKELGGAHEKRGKNLLDWIDTAKKKKITAGIWGILYELPSC